MLIAGAGEVATDAAVLARLPFALIVERAIGVLPGVQGVHELRLDEAGNDDARRR